MQSKRFEVEEVRRGIVLKVRASMEVRVGDWKLGVGRVLQKVRRGKVE